MGFKSGLFGNLLLKTLIKIKFIHFPLSHVSQLMEKAPGGGGGTHANYEYACPAVRGPVYFGSL